MNVLIILGLAIFIGTLSGKVFQKIKIPQVTGYIIAGLLLGPSGFKLLTFELIANLDAVTSIALGTIGFMLGMELKRDIFRNRGRSIYSILLSQGLMTFFFVAAVVSIVTKQLYLGILLGAIATATDPASTVDVLWENKAKGPLSSTLIAIVALDDVLALIIYAFAIIFSKALILHESLSLNLLLHAFYEIGIGTVIGVSGAMIFYGLLKIISDRTRIVPFSIGVILMTVGFSSYFKIDLILASMIAGITLTNVAPQESEEIFKAIKRFSIPLYVLFFVLVGARVDVYMIIGSGATLLLITCLLSRAFGKAIGAALGGMISKAQKTVTRYLGLCLFPQAGVAIGMAISVNHNLAHLGQEYLSIGDTIVNVAVASTFVFQLIGPGFVRLSISKADERGRNVTEEDIIAEHIVSDVIDKDVPVIREEATLDTTVDLIKTSESDHFCVVDEKGKLIGNISIGDLRDVLLEQEMELNRLIRSKDIAVPAARVIIADRPLKEAIDIFRQKELDFLPVVTDEKTKKLVGLMHYRNVMFEIQKELLRRRGSH